MRHSYLVLVLILGGLTLFSCKKEKGGSLAVGEECDQDSQCLSKLCI